MKKTRKQKAGTSIPLNSEAKRKKARKSYSKQNHITLFIVLNGCCVVVADDNDDSQADWKEKRKFRTISLAQESYSQQEEPSRSGTFESSQDT